MTRRIDCQLGLHSWVRHADTGKPSSCIACGRAYQAFRPTPVVWTLWVLGTTYLCLEVALRAFPVEWMTAVQVPDELLQEFLDATSNLAVAIGADRLQWWAWALGLWMVQGLVAVVFTVLGLREGFRALRRHVRSEAAIAAAEESP